MVEPYPKTKIPLLFSPRGLGSFSRAESAAKNVDWYYGGRPRAAIAIIYSTSGPGIPRAPHLND